MARLSLVGVFAGALHSGRHQLGAVDALSPTLDVGGPVGGNALRYFVTVAGVAEANPRVQLTDTGLSFGLGGASSPNTRLVNETFEAVGTSPASQALSVYTLGIRLAGFRVAADNLRGILSESDLFILSSSVFRNDSTWGRVAISLKAETGLETYARLASAAAPLRDSQNVILNVNYWDGALSQLRSSRIQHDVTATTPRSRLIFQIPLGTTILGLANNNGTLEIGFFGVAEAARASAYTQTFATADKTHAVDGSVDFPAGGVGAAAGGWDTAVNRDLAITRFNALRVTVDDLKQLVNAVIDDLQLYGLFQ